MNSRDYLASLGFDTANLEHDINRVISISGHLADVYENARGPLERVEKLLNGVGTAGKNAGSGVEKANKAAQEGSAEWQAYVQKLEAAQKAYREFRQGQVTGEGGGTGINQIPRGQQDELLATHAASGSNVVTDIKAQRKAESDAAKEREQEAAKRIALEEKQAAETTAMWNKVEQRRLQNEQEITRESNRQMEIRAAAYMREQAVEAAASKASQGNLITQRYALYDVATTWGIIGAAIVGVDAALVGNAAAFETSFTNVERTLGPTGGVQGGVDGIRKQLIDLSTQIPLTFDELSKIATLGNQLGVSAKDITTFTATVAKFSTVTGMTVDATAQAFGTLGNLLGVGADQYENLGSSIALVGRNSVATESQIVAVAEQISAGARGAGFAADEVIGLSGALASLKIAPEQARGSLSIYFSALNKAVAGGGQDLQNFATVTGYTAEELDQLVRSGKGGAEVLQAFLKGMNTGDTVQVTQALDALGLSQVRVDNTFRRLTQGIGTYNSTQADAATGFAQGTELSRQFAMRVDDLAAKWQMFLNNLMAFAAAAGTSVLPILGGLIDMASKIVTALRDITSTPAGQFFSTLAVGVTAVIGALILMRAASALATASAYALATANGAASGPGILRGFILLIQSLLGLTSVEGGAIVAAKGLGVALKGALISTGIGAAVVAATSLIFDFGGSMEWLAGVFGMLIDFGNATTGMLNGLVAAGARLVGLGGVADQIDKSTKNGQKMSKDIANGFDSWAKSLKKDTTEAQKFAASTNVPTGPMDDFAGSLDGVADSAGDAAAEVRTLKDYATDLGNVISRAFEIRFSGGQGLDAIATGWNTITKGIADAKAQIAEYQATMQQLTADKAVRQYWLSVAETFGNTLRAGELRAELADIDTKLAKTSGDVASAQDKASGKLDGNSDAAIANRTALLGLVQNYQGYITALASSGASQEDLTAATAAAKDEFTRQATALGFPIAQVNTYAQAFDDVSVAIGHVPRNITVTANTNPALQALAEIEAKARNLSNQHYGGPTIDGMGGGGVSKGVADAMFTAWLVEMRDRYHMSMYQNTAQLAELRRRWDSGLFNGYYEGGWTGGGGNHDVAGLVHKNEYVLNHTGAQMFPRSMLDSANKGQSPFYAGTVKSKGDGGGNGGIMELGPTSLGVLRQIVAKEMSVYLGDADVARSARRGYAEMASTGEI